MKHLSKDFLTIGRGAEYVVKTDDTITIVSAGQVLTITHDLTSKDAATLVLRRPLEAPSSFGEREVVIFKGTAGETMRAFLSLSDRITPRKRWSLLNTIQSLTVSAAAIAIIAALATFFVETRSVPDQFLAEPAVEIPALSGDYRDAIANQDGTNGLQVIKRPEFLSINPPVDSQVPESKAEAIPEPSGDGATTPASNNISDAISNLRFPAFDMKVSPTAGKTATETAVPEKDATAHATSPDDKKSVGSSEAVPANEQKVANSTKKDATSTSETSNAESQSEKAADANETALDHKLMEKDAQAAVQKLIGDGMSQDQIRQLLMDLQSLNAGGADGITPEMLQSLPEEIAAMLADQGMNLDGPNAGTMNILPSEVVDKFRGKDGIASIPENYSWYARSGGPVSIPLPGGGDIKKPEDLIDFGLNP